MSRVEYCERRTSTQGPKSCDRTVAYLKYGLAVVFYVETRFFFFFPPSSHSFLSLFFFLFNCAQRLFLGGFPLIESLNGRQACATKGR